MPLTDISSLNRLDRLSLRRHEADLRVDDCYVCVVYHYWAGRNAWHGTWSSLYPGDAAFSLDMGTLVSRVERSRVQGSSFSLQELPALVFAASKTAILAVDHGSRTPFIAAADNKKQPPLTLNALAVWATMFNPHTACWSLDERPNRAESPFRLFKASSLGSSYHLHWAESGEPLEVGNVYKLARRLSRLVRC